VIEAGVVSSYVRIPEDWLLKYSPKEWIRAALREMRIAEGAYKQQNARAGLAGCRRAAGMALNAALIAEPRPEWKRTYVEHLAGLAKDDTAPAAVREAAALLLATPPPSPSIVQLRSRNLDEKVLEAARDVMAHAYAVVTRHESNPSD
jgi:HEPN domain-containing protein